MLRSIIRVAYQFKPTLPSRATTIASIPHRYFDARSTVHLVEDSRMTSVGRHCRGCKPSPFVFACPVASLLSPDDPGHNASRPYVTASPRSRRRRQHHHRQKHSSTITTITTTDGRCDHSSSSSISSIIVITVTRSATRGRKQ